MRDEHGVAGERREPPQRRRDARRAPQLLVGQPGQPPDRRRQRHARRDERLERLPQLEPAARAPRRSRRSAPRRREPGRLQVEDDERRVLERGVLALDERDERPAPDEPRVLLDERREQRPGRALRQLPRGEQVPRRLVREHPPAALLHELDQPVERVERQLHTGSLYERTFV